MKMKKKNTKKKEIKALDPVILCMLHQLGDENVFTYLISSLDEQIYDLVKDIENEAEYAKYETPAYASAKKEALQRVKYLKKLKPQYVNLQKTVKKAQETFLKLKKSWQ